MQGRRWPGGLEGQRGLGADETVRALGCQAWWRGQWPSRPAGPPSVRLSQHVGVPGAKGKQGAERGDSRGTTTVTMGVGGAGHDIQQTWSLFF